MIKILLVEDHTHTRQLLRTLLEMEGYHVITPPAPNPQSILSVVQAEHPPLMILDAHLQEFSGFDVLASLRQLDPNRRPKVILTSGEDLGPESELAGADAFLLKPFAPQQLFYLIQKLNARDSL